MTRGAVLELTDAEGDLAATILPIDSTRTSKEITVAPRKITWLPGWVNGTFNVSQADTRLFVGSISFVRLTGDTFRTLAVGVSVLLESASTEPESVVEICAAAACTVLLVGSGRRNPA